MINTKFQSCIDTCLSCATLCEYCASECLGEKDVAMMARCIELDRECAEACYASARLMAIGGEHAHMFCYSCAEICDDCADECEKHNPEHCKRCADECRKCADACRLMLQPA